MNSLVLITELVRITLAPFSPAAAKVVGWGPHFLPRVAPLPAALATGSLICNVGAVRPAPADAAPAGGPAPSTAAAPAEEKKVEAKEKKSEESDDDMGFGLFWLNLFRNSQ